MCTEVCSWTKTMVTRGILIRVSQTDLALHLLLQLIRQQLHIFLFCPSLSLTLSLSVYLSVFSPFSSSFCPLHLGGFQLWGGREGVIWSLQALIKTSAWFSGISCTDVWVSVSFLRSAGATWLSLCFSVPAFWSHCTPFFISSGNRWGIQQRQVSVWRTSFLLFGCFRATSGWQTRQQLYLTSELLVLNIFILKLWLIPPATA